jgi:hypothetical protein
MAAEPVLSAPLDAEAFGMSVPPHPRHVRVVRLAGSGIALLAGFDLELIDDFKIALDEIASTLLELGGSSPLDFTFGIDRAGSVSVRATASVAPGAAVDQGRFAFTERVLHVVAESHELRIDGDTAIFMMSVPSASVHEVDDV